MTTTRRDLFKMAGTLGLAGSVGAVASTLPLEAAEAAVTPKPGSAFVPTDQNLHLLRRATFGPTPDLLASVRNKGRAGWLDAQLDANSIDDSDCEKFVKSRFPKLFWTIPEARNKVAKGDRWDYLISLAMATIARQTWSKRQLHEVMCDFWSNHLHVTAPIEGVWFSRHDYDRKVIRQHALGRFEDMLIASAQHPAMLLYLNNAESTKVEPNENYGRELLELHTVGLDASYSEAEMFDSALIMTGFTVDAEDGTFRYNGYSHHTGPVKVLDFEDNNPTGGGGYDVALRYLRYLAQHPSTARHIARKLCVRFVSDEPDEALVDALAQTYLDNESEIAPVLRHLFTSEAFESSLGDKTRRPLEDVIATLRILGFRPEQRGTDAMRSLYYICNEVGQAPFAWDLPDGYPDTATAWQSAGTTLNRWNRHLSLAGGWFPKTLRKPPLRSLLPKRLPRTFGGMVDDLAKRLVFRELSKEHRDVVLSLLQRRAGDPFTANHADAHWLMAPAVAIILDSPYHGIR